MGTDRKYYWTTQWSAWTLWASLLSIWNWLNTDLSALDIGLLFFFTLVIGVGLSHLLRSFMISAGWLTFPLGRLVPRALVAALICGLLYSLVFASMLDLFVHGIDRILVRPYDQVFPQAITWILLSMIWCAAYLVYNYVRNYERQEVKTLKLEASKNRVELANLRSQLNPHFMFNSMNSIRALINEDPDLAKTAITKLSNILRSTLVSGRKQVVTLEEELAIVQDHLALEKIRYEERLETSFDIGEEVMHFKLPPLMIQTLVENAIKHGISRLKDGGHLSLSAHEERGGLEIIIENSGQYQLNGRHKSGTGIGLENTRRRLDILYGSDAELTIANLDSEKVRCRLYIPRSKTE